MVSIAAGFRNFLRRREGMTLTEVLVTISIMSILAGVSVYIVKGLFDSTIRGNVHLNQQSEIHNISSFVSQQMESTYTGDVGLKNGGQINPTSIAGDQVVFQAENYCYRLFHNEREETLNIAAAQAIEGQGCASIAPKRGPNEKVQPYSGCNDPCYVMADSSNPRYDWVLDSPANPPSQFDDAKPNVAVLAQNMAAEKGETEVTPFTYFRKGQYASAISDQLLSRHADSAASTTFYNNSGNLDTLGAIQVRLYALGIPSKSGGLTVSPRLWSQVFYLGGGNGGPGGSPGPGGERDGSGRFPKVIAATTQSLPANSYNNADQTITSDTKAALPAIDGVEVKAGDKILVNNETDQRRNGVYEVLNAGGNTTGGMVEDPIENMTYLYWPQLGTETNGAIKSHVNDQEFQVIDDVNLPAQGPNPAFNAAGFTGDGTLHYHAPGLFAGLFTSGTTVSMRAMRTAGGDDEQALWSYLISVPGMQSCSPWLGVNSSGDVFLGNEEAYGDCYSMAGYPSEHVRVTWEEAMPDTNQWYGILLNLDFQNPYAPVVQLLTTENGVDWTDHGEQPMPMSLMYSYGVPAVLLEGGWGGSDGGTYLGSHMAGTKGMFHGRIAQFAYLNNGVSGDLYEEYTPVSGGEHWVLQRADGFDADSLLEGGDILSVISGSKFGSGLMMLSQPTGEAQVGTDDLHWVPTSADDDTATPIGAVLPYAGSNIPAGYLEANGSPFQRSEYPKLAEILDCVSTTCQTPDLQSRVVIGRGQAGNRGPNNANQLKAVGGAREVTLSVQQMPSHDHGPAGKHRHGASGLSTSTAPNHSHSLNDAYIYGPVIGRYFLHGTYSCSGNCSAVSGWLPLWYAGQSLHTSPGGSHSHSVSGNTAESGEHTHESRGGGQAHENMPPYIVLNYIIKAK